VSDCERFKKYPATWRLAAIDLLRTEIIFLFEAVENTAGSFEYKDSALGIMYKAFRFTLCNT
jgi:hypothetical protein